MFLAKGRLSAMKTSRKDTNYSNGRRAYYGAAIFRHCLSLPFDVYFSLRMNPGKRRVFTKQKEINYSLRSLTR